MSDRDTGGAAFPMMSHTNCHGLLLEEQTGMALRDYFAAKALQSILTLKIGTREEIVERAYGIADAMLKARKK